MGRLWLVHRTGGGSGGRMDDKRGNRELGGEKEVGRSGEERKGKKGRTR